MSNGETPHWNSSRAVVLQRLIRMMTVSAEICDHSSVLCTILSKPVHQIHRAEAVRWMKEVSLKNC